MLLISLNKIYELFEKSINNIIRIVKVFSKSTVYDVHITWRLAFTFIKLLYNPNVIVSIRELNN